MSMPEIDHGPIANFIRPHTGADQKSADDVKRALLGDHEAAKRLTDAGVRIPCRCGAKGEIITMTKYGENRWKPAVIRCPKCHYEACLTDWNTRAPILSAEELQRLEEEV